ncbi:hypothetical protein MRX96_046214 [Rhipicephalus microplus]
MFDQVWLDEDDIDALFPGLGLHRPCTAEVHRNSSSTSYCHIIDRLCFGTAFGGTPASSCGSSRHPENCHSYAWHVTEADGRNSMVATCVSSSTFFWSVIDASSAWSSTMFWWKAVDSKSSESASRRRLGTTRVCGH